MFQLVKKYFVSYYSWHLIEKDSIFICCARMHSMNHMLDNQLILFCKDIIYWCIAKFWNNINIVITEWVVVLLKKTAGMPFSWLQFTLHCIPIIGTSILQVLMQVFLINTLWLHKSTFWLFFTIFGTKNKQ